MKKLMLLAVLVALMCSCNGNKFKVSGTVEGAGDTTTLYLETTINGNWLFVDSVKTSAGKFAFTEDAAEYPNIYRLGYRDKNIYFPIDSIDNIEIKTSLAKFDEDYTLSGSDNAVKVMNIDKQAAKFSKAGDTSSDAYKKWKEQLSRDLVKDPASIVSFYLINKYIGNQPLFDPIDNHNFKQGLSQRRSMSTASRDTIVATQALLIDVKLQDKKGKMQSLQEVSSHGNVVLLNFTMQDQSFSPALNKLLNEMYTKYKSRGFEIFQVCLDSNEAQWMQAVASLPWIVMRDPDGEYSRNAGAYNITSIPTIFIIDRKGEIVEKVANIEQLEASLTKYL